MGLGKDESESHHGNSGGDIDAVHIVAVDHRIVSEYMMIHT